MRIFPLAVAILEFAGCWEISIACAWVMATTNRCGSLSAARLVKSLSPHCSRGLFERLEEALVTYRDPDEKGYAVYLLQGRRQGCYEPYWGRGKCFLLPALSQERRSEHTIRVVGWLCRTFAKYPDSYFTSSSDARGGWIGSTLDPRLDRISDRAWLAIVSNKDIPEESHGEFRQLDEDHAAVSSVWQFSQSLGRVARRFPERFGKLALRFPDNTGPAYVSAILGAYLFSVK